jgi:hypothetical protein
MALLLVANLGLNVAAWHGARLVHAYRVRTHEQGPSWPLEVEPVAVTWRVGAAGAARAGPVAPARGAGHPGG